MNKEVGTARKREQKKGNLMVKIEWIDKFLDETSLIFLREVLKII